MTNCESLGSRYRLVSIAALNGKIYNVCLYWDLYNPQTGEYLYRWPDKIQVEGGYLVKDATLVNRYNFVISSNGNGGGNGVDKIVNKKKEEKKDVPYESSGQLIPGIDNKYLIIGGIALLILSRN